MKLLKKYWGLATVMSVALMFTVIKFAMAGDLEVPVQEPWPELLKLIQNIGAWGPWAIASSVSVILAGFARMFIKEAWVAKAVVTACGVVYGVAKMVLNSGMGTVDAIVTALFVMGGAALLYDYVIKPIWGKIFPTKVG